ncbi:MAG: T9SS type A sorting domain-containing protein [Flavobacteriaceae bacterium]|nr:T9SS type A sorting domain-containing protein [Flavobacteriaceae bacterium]
MKKFTLLIFLLINHLSFSQITAWDTNGLSGNEVTFNATTQDPNLNISTLSRGSGINPSNLANAFSSNNFTLSNSQALAIANDDYLEFNISAISGYKVSLSSLDVNFRRPSTGPDNFLWRYSLDGTNFINIGSSIIYNLNPTNGTAQSQIDLSVIPELQNVFNTTITFRLYAWGATGSTGSFAIGRLAGNDLEINGLVEALCASTVTWDGTSWSPSTPDSSTNAILTSNYNTNIAGQTSFSACSLTLNSGIELTIAPNTYVEINNDVTNNGRINIQNQGSFVQIEDTAVYDDSGSSFPDAAIVDRETAHLDNWYEYTYWSSPVANETFGNALFQSSPYRRFGFNAANFRDSQYETFNDDTLINGAGVDDIDDNGDDWFLKSSGDIMTPGVGYAATHSISAFIFGPNNYVYTFRGILNNGDITVPIERNDAETGDNNWNLVGNPYPSAIDVDLFFAENNLALNPTDGKLTGTIYLWSQNTAPTSTANGNQQLNFSNSDYATINGTMETVGGDGLTPNRYIPSGQGFFVLYDDAATSATGSVIFKNSMRVSGNNDQFFRASSTNNPNKIWLRLTSDIGLNNQIGIGYVNGATSQNDGGFYDAKKTGAVMNSLAFYSVIPGDNNKFVIQGKAPSDLSVDEVIPLGFLTNIDVVTIYTISIDNLEGDFLTNNTVYLKDNLNSTIHDLTASDYNFTSVVGEFNNRFEIVFNNASLSIDNNEITSNNLSIIELENDNIMFKVGQNFTIQSIQIFDTLGKEVYNFKGENSTETYNIKELSSSLYIAKVTLNNGQTITKKAIKK